MKSLAFAAALVTLTAAPALADPVAPPAVPAMAPKFSIDTPIEQLVADPAAKAVLDADFPGMAKHPMYDSFKSMSLKQLQPMSNGKISDASLVKAAADLGGVK